MSRRFFDIAEGKGGNTKMMITELRKRRGRLVLLVLDGEPAMTVDVRTFEESPYRVGSSLSDEELKALLEESARRRARERAVYLLSRSDHSRRGLEEKLAIAWDSDPGGGSDHDRTTLQCNTKNGKDDYYNSSVMLTMSGTRTGWRRN